MTRRRRCWCCRMGLWQQFHPHLQGVNWTYLATTTSDDKLIGAQSIAVEEDIGRVGYALVMRTG